MVTAKATELDTVKALDMGADDYIAKPFGVMELISRIKAVLRRKSFHSDEELLEFANITLDVKKHLVLVDNELCELTFKEFELLKYLMMNHDLVLSRDKILQGVWGYEFEGETRTVDMHIKSLRQKLNTASAYIKTVRNVGYKVSD
jgi:two-component system alkaline phosphatase synthesis response regulator PhoP